MPHETPTVRDQVIARLSEYFGPHRILGESVHWTITPRVVGRHASIGITLNAWKSPQAVRLWVFDPSKQGEASTQHFEIEIDDQIEPVLRNVHSLVNGNARPSLASG